jgi:hypothetical protein
MFAEREFLFVSPFDRTLFFHQRLSFDPVWTGEDPASAGEMFVQPQERMTSPFPGLPGPDVGPYHYFYAADSSHLAVFETTYVHRLDPTPPSGRLVFAANASLAAPPLVFYDQDMVNPLENFRAGPGQAVLLPLTNRTVEITNVTGKVKTWLPLILDGQPAEIAGPIGFVRTSYPVWVYMPLRSSSSTGIVALDLATLTPAFQYSMPGTLLDVVGTPTSYRGTFLFLGLYDATTDTTQFGGLNETGARLPSFGATVAGRAVTYFETDELSRLFVQSKGGAVVTLRTRGGTAGEPPQEFSIRPPSAESWLMYAGSPGGTLYGAALIPQELVGAWTDSASARTALFELLGVPQPQPTVSTDGLRGTPAGIPSATWMIDGLIGDHMGKRSRATSLPASLLTIMARPRPSLMKGTAIVITDSAVIQQSTLFAGFLETSICLPISVREREREKDQRSSSCWDGTTFCSWRTSIRPRLCRTLTCP